MGSHPVNLLIRFLLELTALISVGFWAWRQGGSWRLIMALGIPIVLTVIWGTFAVPGDPSRSGTAPIATPGIIRLVIELAIFAAATWAIFGMGYTKASLIFGTIVILHYIASYDRILWLWSK